MEFVCRQCEGNAFLLLPEEAGTVTAECLGCGTSTLIETRRRLDRAAIAGIDAR